MSTTPPWRLRAGTVAVVLALLLAACTTNAPTPAPTATSTPLAPTDAATPIGTASPSPTALGPSPTPTPATAPSASASPTTTPTFSAPPSPTPLPTPAGPPEGDYEARLQGILEAQRELYRIPGLGAAVLFADGTRWTGGAGFGQLEARSKASGDTPYVAGSISKTFVAATILQLAEEGELTLDDTLSRWVPDYPGADQITLRQLLSHTSGAFNYFEHPTYNRLVFGRPLRAWTPQNILNTFRAAPYFEPGDGYHYSNTGFVLLGMVIEAQTGNSLDEEYERRFFDPLGLDDTYFQADEPPPAASAHGYLVGQNGPRLINDGTNYRPTTSAATVAWAAGSVVSSADDLATWADALYAGDVLEPESVAEMTDFTANVYAGATYGLGTRTRLIEGRRVVGHTGSLRGFSAAMWHFMHEGITVVVLSNRGRVDVNPIADRLAAAALRAAGYQVP